MQLHLLFIRCSDMKWQTKHTSLTVIAIGFGALYLFFRKEWMLVPVGTVFIGFLIGPVGEYIHLAWMMIAKVLGYINSRILLTVSFFLILTPVAVVARMMKKTNFRISADKADSLFITRNHLYSKKDLAQPW